MTATLTGHDVLHNRYRFHGRLELATALRLSSGKAAELTDAPLMRNRRGVPIIPGSSLRGAIRAEVERVLAGVGTAAGLRSCVLFTPDRGQGACPTASQEKQQKLGELARADEAAAFALLERDLCDVCRLFGSPVYASRLRLEDCLPEGGTTLAEQSLVRDGVGIDRDTGAARESIKFNFEVLEVGPIFAFAMEAENLGPPGSNDRKLIDLILRLLRGGLFVGGKRAAGLGRVRLRPDGFEVSGFESPEALWQALSHGRDPHAKLDWKEAKHAPTPTL